MPNLPTRPDGAWPICCSPIEWRRGCEVHQRLHSHPQKNVGLVKDFFDAYNARDVEAVDRLLASDAVVTTLSARAGLPARWEPGETKRYFRQLDEAWADLRVEIEDLHELGDR